MGSAANTNNAVCRLPEAEKSRVIDALKNSGVVSDPVTGIYWSPMAVTISRMTLAAQGLPASAASGYEQLDSIQMGSSRSVEAARLKQSQEVELGSISEIDMVMSARVHLHY